MAGLSRIQRGSSSQEQVKLCFLLESSAEPYAVDWVEDKAVASVAGVIEWMPSDPDDGDDMVVVEEEDAAVLVAVDLALRDEEDMLEAEGKEDRWSLLEREKRE